MLNRLYLYLGAVVVFVLLLGGVYVKGRFDGANKVQDQWDDQKLAMAEEVIQAVERNFRQEQKYARLQIALDGTIKAKAAVDQHNDDLARRLRQAYQAPRPGALPQVTQSSSDPPPASRIAPNEEELDRSVKEHLSACDRDAIRLDGWREWWEEVRRLQQPPGAEWKTPFPTVSPE